MGPVNLRPKGALTDAEVYNPGRDLANCGNPLLKRTILDLRAGEPAWIFEALEARGGPAATAAVEGALCDLARGARTLATDPDADFDAALAAFNADDALARLAVLARFGMLCFGSMIHGIRDVTPLDGTSSQQLSVEDVVRAAEAHSGCLKPRGVRHALAQLLRECLRLPGRLRRRLPGARHRDDGA